VRISFDLDEVLFVDPGRYETEPPLRFPFDRLFTERLRKGTVWLIGELKRRGFEVWVYTSSHRTVTYIAALFRHYRVYFDEIVNADRHEREVQAGHARRLPAKLPNRYRISLHIDDEDAIIRSARDYGYRVMRVYEPDPEWADKVLQEALRVRAMEEGAK